MRLLAEFPFNFGSYPVLEGYNEAQGKRRQIANRTEQVLFSGYCTIEKKLLHEVYVDTSIGDIGSRPQISVLGFFLSEGEAHAYAKGKGAWGPQTDASVKKPSLRKVLTLSNGEMFFLGGRVGAAKEDLEEERERKSDEVLQKAKNSFSAEELELLRKALR